jgi:hypothetical protein
MLLVISSAIRLKMLSERARRAAPRPALGVLGIRLMWWAQKHTPLVQLCVWGQARIQES